MDTTSLRSLLDATPFHPFVLRMLDGEEYKIWQPDQIAIHPSAQLVILWRSHGKFTLLTADHISSADASDAAIDKVRKQMRREMQKIAGLK